MLSACPSGDTTIAEMERKKKRKKEKRRENVFHVMIMVCICNFDTAVLIEFFWGC